MYRLDAGGKLKQVVALPAGSWPNGIAFHGRYLYMTDSGMGAVWRARVDAGMASPSKPWLQSDLLAPGDPATDATMTGIGANGIAFRGAQMFVSVADYGSIVRIPVRGDGSPGTPVVVCETPELKTADGIAFDAFGGLWVTTDAGTTGASPSGASLPADTECRSVGDRRRSRMAQLPDDARLRHHPGYTHARCSSRTARSTATKATAPRRTSGLCGWPSPACRSSDGSAQEW